MAKPEKVLIFCAHNDDQIIGAGGTILKYAEQGKDIHVFIFSYGEKSHPHFQRKVIIGQRVKESKKSDSVLGVRETKYFGLKEGAFREDVRKKKVDKKIRKIIEENKPSKIFIHSIDDPHPDHRAVHHIINDIAESMDYKGEVYSFEIWNLLTFRKRNKPKLVVDISSKFQRKVRALKKHDSQQITIWTLMWNIYLKAMLNGFNNGVKYAEVFYRVR